MNGIRPASAYLTQGIMNVADPIHIRLLNICSAPLGVCGYWMYGRALAVTLHLPPIPQAGILCCQMFMCQL
jgi:hypothetical protein